MDKIIDKILKEARWIGKVAVEFPNQKAMQKYLKEHPDANPKNHHVKRDEKKPKSVKDDLKEKLEKKKEEVKKVQIDNPETVKKYKSELANKDIISSEHFKSKADHDAFLSENAALSESGEPQSILQRILQILMSMFIGAAALLSTSDTDSSSSSSSYESNHKYDDEYDDDDDEIIDLKKEESKWKTGLGKLSKDEKELVNNYIQIKGLKPGTATHDNIKNYEAFRKRYPELSLDPKNILALLKKNQKTLKEIQPKTVTEQKKEPVKKEIVKPKPIVKPIEKKKK